MNKTSYFRKLDINSQSEIVDKILCNHAPTLAKKGFELIRELQI